MGGDKRGGGWREARGGTDESEYMIACVIRKYMGSFACVNFYTWCKGEGIRLLQYRHDTYFERQLALTNDQRPPYDDKQRGFETPMQEESLTSSSTATLCSTGILNGAIYSSTRHHWRSSCSATANVSYIVPAGTHLFSCRPWCGLQAGKFPSPLDGQAPLSTSSDGPCPGCLFSR